MARQGSVLDKFVTGWGPWLMKPSSAAASGERFVQVNIKQGQLQFENDLFLKGDPAIAQVVVADGKNAANSCVSGVISSINNSEVICIVHNLSLCQHVIFSLFSYDRFPK